MPDTRRTIPVDIPGVRLNALSTGFVCILVRPLPYTQLNRSWILLLLQIHLLWHAVPPIHVLAMSVLKSPPNYWLFKASKCN